MSGWIILTCFFVWIPNHLVSAHEYNYYKTATHTSEDVDAIREKWGVNEIIRDLDHIREDISKVLQMEQTGLISTKEAIFYFFKMHDFDNNEKLDGLEYLVAMSHSMEHMIDISTEDLDEISRAIDLFLSYDGNSDGFISYYEYKQHLKES